MTLGSGAQINKEALVDPSIELSSTQVVGCVSGFSSNPMNFVKQYAYLPTIAFNSLEDLKKYHKEDQSLMFYYPTVPSKKRDDSTIDLIKHFPKSLMLLEKPSHNKADEAKQFKQ